MNSKAALLLAITGLLLTGCSGYKYKEDNIVEEGMEVAIDHFSGIDVDLSPNTKESGFSPKALKPFERLESSLHPSARQSESISLDKKTNRVCVAIVSSHFFGSVC